MQMQGPTWLFFLIGIDPVAVYPMIIFPWLGLINLVFWWLGNSILSYVLWLHGIDPTWHFLMAWHFFWIGMDPMCDNISIIGPNKSSVLLTGSSWGKPVMCCVLAGHWSNLTFFDSTLFFVCLIIDCWSGFTSFDSTPLLVCLAIDWFGL